MDLVDAIYRQCHDHLRDADKKRDQIIAFYAIVVGFFFTAGEKIDDRIKPFLPVIIGLVGVFVLFAVIQYRKWHIIYSNSFRALQDAVHADPKNIQPYLLERTWNDVNRRGFWRQLSFFDPTRGTEAATFAALVVLTFAPWYIVLKLISPFIIERDITGFTIGVAVYGLLVILVGAITLKWSAEKSMYCHWILRPFNPEHGTGKEATEDEPSRREKHCAKLKRFLMIVALFSGFLGAMFGFLASRRVASRFSPDGVSLGYGAEYSTWFWQHCGEIGFLLITVAFLLQLIANLIPDRK